MSEHFGSLALPVGEFLALEHGTEFDGYTIRSDRTSMDATEIEVCWFVCYNCLSQLIGTEGTVGWDSIWGVEGFGVVW